MTAPAVAIETAAPAPGSRRGSIGMSRGALRVLEHDLLVFRRGWPSYIISGISQPFLYLMAMGVGLAATQLGILRRVLVYQAGSDNEPSALVNPVIEWMSEEEAIAEEGCLSLPRVTMDVERAVKAGLTLVTLARTDSALVVSDDSGSIE